MRRPVGSQEVLCLFSETRFFSRRVGRCRHASIWRDAAAPKDLIERLFIVDQFCGNKSSIIVLSALLRFRTRAVRSVIERFSIQQLKGQTCIHLAERKVNVSAGHLLVLDCGVLHDVEALDESALLLTISWRTDKRNGEESFSSAQRQLDEEAVSRMDDEGGAPDVIKTSPGR